MEQEGYVIGDLSRLSFSGDDAEGCESADDLAGRKRHWPTRVLCPMNALFGRGNAFGLRFTKTCDKQMLAHSQVFVRVFLES